MTPAAHVLDVTDQTFEQEVLERSRQTPVLVDFWAEWCAPCRVLGPILEKVVADYAGKVVLAKVNADENPNLVYAFQVQGIPMVALLVGGQVVDGFSGAQPESAVRALLERHVSTTAEDRLRQAEAALAAGDPARARRLVDALLREKDVLPGARLLRARLALLDGDAAALREQVAALPAETPEARQGETLLAGLEFLAGAPADPGPWLARVAANPDDHEARYEAGRAHAAAGRYREALEGFLEIVRRDRAWREDAGRKGMLAVFHLLGPGHPLATEFRRQLTIYL